MIVQLALLTGRARIAPPISPMKVMWLHDIESEILEDLEGQTAQGDGAMASSLRQEADVDGRGAL